MKYILIRKILLFYNQLKCNNQKKFDKLINKTLFIVL